MTRIAIAAALSIVLALMGALIVGVATPTQSTMVERAAGWQPVPAIRSVEGPIRYRSDEPRLNLTDRPGMPFLIVVPAGDGSSTIELRRCCERDIVAPMRGW